MKVSSSKKTSVKATEEKDNGNVTLTNDNPSSERKLAVTSQNSEEV